MDIDPFFLLIFVLAELTHNSIAVSTRLLKRKLAMGPLSPRDAYLGFRFARRMLKPVQLRSRRSSWVRE